MKSYSPFRLYRDDGATIRGCDGKIIVIGDKDTIYSQKVDDHMPKGQCPFGCFTDRTLGSPQVWLHMTSSQSD
jgi:hypothetical protein